MKVFGIGMNKTGTKTLGSCFTVLGLRNRSYAADLLLSYSTGDFSAIFEVSDRFDSFEDWPWPLLYKEFDARYPEALFILTLRKDPETWFESLCKHADRTGPTDARKIVYGHAMPRDYKEEHLRIYNRHNKEVEDYFRGRPHKLLKICWEDGDGWPEICAFLGLPVPGLPFPHENQAPRINPGQP